MFCDSAAPFDPNWQDKYQDKMIAMEKAIGLIQSGQHIFLGTGCAQPTPLVISLVGRSTTLANNEIVDLFTLGDAPYARRDITDNIHVSTFFISDNVRDIIEQGLGTYTPVSLSDIPRLLSSEHIHLDVALIQVSPPDRQGRFSLGVSVDIIPAAIHQARLVIAQVNVNMPRVLGNSFVTIEDLDWLVAADNPLTEYHPPTPSAVDHQVAQQVASLIENGSTLSVDIGEIPQAVLSHLGTKRDLGIHSEMITSAYLQPIRDGIFTGRAKSLDPERIVASYCLGNRPLYDLLHNNPLVNLHPTEYVSDPLVIGKQHRMVAVSSAIEIDLTGQVCTSSIGMRSFSGPSGRVDFNRGACRAPGGKAIVALTSTADNGRVSRIVTHLARGAGVEIMRSDVHYVVTEFGTAYLYGKNIQERALSLIGIAHPDFQEQLLSEAIAAHFVHPELSDVQGRQIFPRMQFSSTLHLADGRSVEFRFIQPSDDHIVRKRFHALSPQTVYYRFMAPLKRLSFKQIMDLVYVDQRVAAAIGGFVPGLGRDGLIALAGYHLEPHSNSAEVAFLIHDNWQRHGIGSHMFHTLAGIARRNGITRFTADVLPGNIQMQRVFQRAGLPFRHWLDDGTTCYEIDLVG
ncbi:MAG: GNAT family N-acetyltransferase [Magnetococcales bacterium]|nr:GNAT family N-acetyltransferase [Magnetococcales bacterium]